MSKKKCLTTAENFPDQTMIQMDHASYEKFIALLDRPAQPNERLRKTLRTPPPWES